MVKILLVDDHRMFRQGLRQLFALGDEIEVVGEASTAPEALEFLSLQSVDVVLMDVNLAEQDGLWATRQIRQLHPKIPVLTLTVHEDRSTLMRAFESGAHGYIVKTATHEELLTAIRAVVGGGMYVYSGVAAPLLSLVRNDVPQSTSEGAVTHFLSPRELEVLSLVANGLGNVEISHQLHVSVSTVKTQMRSLFNKLGVNDRTNLLLEAFRRNLLENPRCP